MNDFKIVATIVGLIAGLLGIVGFWISNTDAVRDWWIRREIGPQSVQAQFIFGDWCAENGMRQRIANTQLGPRITTCIPDAHGNCGLAFAEDLADLPEYPIEFGWERGMLTYRVGDAVQPLLVRQISSDAMVQQMAGVSADGVLLRRCD